MCGGMHRRGGFRRAFFVFAAGRERASPAFGAVLWKAWAGTAAAQKFLLPMIGK